MRFSTASCSAASIRSEAHVPAVLLPQPAHRGFCDARFARLDAAPAHLDERRALRRACRAALHEPGRGAVLERDVACGTDEVRLPHAQLVHLRVVRLVAEAGPHELGPARSLRQHLPHGQADRKSTRLNSSHTVISYAVFCLKKKTHCSLTRNAAKTEPCACASARHASVAQR